MTNTKRKTVTIKRSKWASARRLSKWNEQQRRIEDPEDEGNFYEVDAALLVAENDTMCCLGFVCRKLGKTADEIRGKGLPSEFDDMPDWLVEIETPASTINDDPKLTDRQREVKLRKLFREKSPIDLKFVP